MFLSFYGNSLVLDAIQELWTPTIILSDSHFCLNKGAGCHLPLELRGGRSQKACSGQGEESPLSTFHYPAIGKMGLG